MSVIGIDFGNESCFIAAAKAGGIETIANDYSLRATPSYVAFTGKNRTLGVGAKNQQVTNMRNTIYGFKHLLGRKFKDPLVQKELHSLPYRVEERPDGSIGIRVNYMDEEQVFSPEQITAMLFTKLKADAAVELKAQMYDCVITVPSYFTNAERKALLDAAGIAGLNCLRLLNETTATALSYGFYRTDLPAPEEKPRNIIFVDFGHSAIQVSACAFSKGKLKMLAATSDLVGGRDVDEMLASHISDEFIKKYKFDPRTNKKAYLRLLTEVEKLKKQMSANSTKLPLNIECFMNDTDVASAIQRNEMEEICASVFQRVEACLRKCLKDSKLQLEDIHAVEIVGGSSRIPAVKLLVEQIFGKVPSTQLNQDEAVSRGGALQCAILSPAVRVRDFSVSDIQPYAVNLAFDNENGARTVMEVFPAHHQAPFSRLLTMFRREAFAITLYYADPSPCLDPFIGEWQVKDVKPSVTGEGQEVKVKVRINHNGLLLVSSAQMYEKKEAQEGEPNGNENEAPQQPPTPSADEANASQESQNSSTGEPMDTGAPPEDKKKKSASKIIELSITAKTHGYSQIEFDKYFEFEGKMISNDLQEKDRVDARNALEEFVYDMRGKLQEGGILFEYVDESSRGQLCNQLDDVENWLYEDGESCEREVYKTKLNELRQKTDAIQIRHDEYEGQGPAFDQLGHAIQMAYKAVELYRSGDPKYDHLTETEILNISEATEKTQKWFQDASSKMRTLRRTEDPIVKLADIRHECQTLTTCVNSVINRPKPRPPTPPKADNPPPSSQENGPQQEQQQQQQQQNTSQSTFKDGEMDVD